jgi:cell division protein FtsL
MYVSDGSLARQYIPETKEEAAVRKKRELEKAKEQKMKLKAVKKSRKKLVISILAILSMGFLVIYGQVRNYELQMQIDKVNSKIVAVQDEKSRAILELEKSRNLGQIEKAATEELGMSKATRDQIVYFNPQKTDTVLRSMDNSSTVDKVVERSAGLLDGILEKIRNIFG